MTASNFIGDSGLPRQPGENAPKEEWQKYAASLKAVVAAEEHRANFLHTRLNTLISSPAWKALKKARQFIDSSPLGRAKKFNVKHFLSKQQHAAVVKGHPLVSILIPFRDQPKLLENCLSSIHGKSSYQNTEIVLIDNGSVQPATGRLLSKLKSSCKPPRSIKTVRVDEPFNFSRLINVGAQHASGEYLLLLNNDVEVLTPGWLEALLEQNQREHTGAVGARLLYPDGRIQHAGVQIGGDDIAAHSFRLSPADDPRVEAVRECSAVTGACLMTHADLFKQLGGLNVKELPIAYSDVDYCLRAREMGLRVVYTPHATLIHHETVSRGNTNSPSESTYMCRRWAREICDGACSGK